MKDIDVNLLRPFGPIVIQSKCPEEILESLNKYIEDVSRDIELSYITSSKYKNIPDLLDRNLENIFLTYKFTEDCGLKEIIEKLAKCYLEVNDCNSECNVELIKINSNSYHDKKKFILKDLVEYSDCWVNVYRNSDYTPIHTHMADLSGILFLKIPNEVTNKLNDGHVEFLGEGPTLKFNNSSWIPDHEVGSILIFPSWLRHVVYPSKCNNERITLSFNLNIIEKN